MFCFHFFRLLPDLRLFAEYVFAVVTQEGIWMAKLTRAVGVYSFHNTHNISWV